MTPNTKCTVECANCKAEGKIYLITGKDKRLLIPKKLLDEERRYSLPERERRYSLRNTEKKLKLKKHGNATDKQKLVYVVLGSIFWISIMLLTNYISLQKNRLASRNSSFLPAQEPFTIVGMSKVTATEGMRFYLYGVDKNAHDSGLPARKNCQNGCPCKNFICSKTQYPLKTNVVVENYAYDSIYHVLTNRSNLFLQLEVRDKRLVGNVLANFEFDFTAVYSTIFMEGKSYVFIYHAYDRFNNNYFITQTGISKPIETERIGLSFLYLVDEKSLSLKHSFGKTPDFPPYGLNFIFGVGTIDSTEKSRIIFCGTRLDEDRCFFIESGLIRNFRYSKPPPPSIKSDIWVEENDRALKLPVDNHFTIFYFRDKNIRVDSLEPGKNPSVSPWRSEKYAAPRPPGGFKLYKMYLDAIPDKTLASTISTSNSLSQSIVSTRDTGSSLTDWYHIRFSDTIFCIFDRAT
ncbi:Oidioi.mRNA.OKI2018_I69.chr1.g3584.t1.cds [Oikopleura dioica]|uniref:Oidioi.mRNA.OKI2018_I69.chr1.g3584.t1.cds n=1 Tax=Oikopleura dioica TaxID=34765 RepID=A0ABN7SYW6_OIKDI|nr:Oidioi.mRNA.OKI2018_I69.chr1.g3584.t1.cds [Oikopleura dioica]